jgi:hypothetical protein
MPGVQYYLRQARAFSSLAQSTTDPQLYGRYLMMAQQYTGIANDLARGPKLVEPEIMDHGDAA